jgi:hypothetical protein
VCAQNWTSKIAHDVVKCAQGWTSKTAYLALSHETPEQAAASTGLPPTQVEGLIRLGSAPEFIQSACANGLGDDLPARVVGEEREELAERRPTLWAAMEFLHAYEQLQRRLSETTVRNRQKVQKLVRQALLEDWSIRHIKAAVRELLGSGGRAHKGERSARRAGGRRAPRLHRRRPRRDHSPGSVRGHDRG